MTTLVSLFLKSFGGKLSRAAVAWLTALMASHAYEADTHSFSWLVISLCGFGLVTVWSVIVKHTPDKDTVDKIKDFVGALGSLALPALFGWLNTKGISLTGNESAEDALVILLAALASHIRAPDARPGNAARLKLGSALFLAMLLPLASCASIATHSGHIRVLGSSGSYTDPQSKEAITWDNSVAFTAATDAATSIATPGTVSGILTAAGKALARLWPSVFGPSAPTPSGK